MNTIRIRAGIAGLKIRYFGRLNRLVISGVTTHIVDVYIEPPISSGVRVVPYADSVSNRDMTGGIGAASCVQWDHSCACVGSNPDCVCSQ